MSAITVSIPGTADTRMADGDIFTEDKALGQRYREQGKLRRYGRGFAWIATLPAIDWQRIADYLRSVEGANASALAHNPGEAGPSLRAELKAVRTALQRIEEALKANFIKKVDEDGAAYYAQRRAQAERAAQTTKETPVQIVATFSVSAGMGAAIYVSSLDSLEVLASAHPSVTADPLEALRDIGYQLAYPTQRYSFAETMAKTGYQSVHVVPIPR